MYVYACIYIYVYMIYMYLGSYQFLPATGLRPPDGAARRLTYVYI